MDLPLELDKIIDYAHPDSLWVAAERHSGWCYTVWILDLDYAYHEYRAHLSMDGRWTLSPTRDPWHTNETGGEHGRSATSWVESKR